MKNSSKISAFTVGIIASAAAGTTALASTDSHNHDISSHCATPVDRDYREVLSAYKNETSGSYKFSGCGGAI